MVTSSVLTLTVISIERFFAIVFPLRGKMSIMVTGLLIALSWLVSAAIAAPQLFVRQVLTYEYSNRNDVFCVEIWPKVYKNTACVGHEPWKTVYYTIEGIVMYVIPVVIMIGAYSVIAFKLLLRRVPGNTIGSRTSSQDRTRKKVSTTRVFNRQMNNVCKKRVLLSWRETSDKTYWKVHSRV